MSYNVDMKISDRDKKIIGLYINGRCAKDLGEQFGISERQVQRIVRRAGHIRTQSESYILAIKQGRMKYHKLPENLKKKRKSISRKKRFEVLRMFKYTCQTCGRKPIDGYRIEIDHIDNDPTNNDINNLQVLCSECNRGKAFSDMYGDV